MPEDQGVNGDMWNDEATRLVSKFGWQQIGDGNVDVLTTEKKMRGIDRMFKYQDIRRHSSMEQGVFMEAKRYKTTSFTPGALKEWVLTINTKLSKIRNEISFYETFPAFNNCALRNGLIVIWFSDLKNYNRNDFQKTLAQLKLPNGRKEETKNRIYVMDNYDILRLASLSMTIDNFNSSNNTILKFFYPTVVSFNSVVSRSTSLTLDYMYSKFILAEANIKGVEHRVVFYFGAVTTKSFIRLKSALQDLLFVDNEKPLRMYIYNRDDDNEYRKIMPDIKKQYEGIDFQPFLMDMHHDIPAFMKSL